MSITTTLSVSGMSCSNCVRHATEALLAVPGVEEAHVTLEPSQAVVVHSSPDQVPQLVAALEEEGYPAEPAQQS